jgi:hypothetical protein
MLQSSLEDLKKLHYVNSITYAIYTNQHFWKEKLLNDFPFITIKINKYPLIDLNQLYNYKKIYTDIYNYFKQRTLRIVSFGTISKPILLLPIIIDYMTISMQHKLQSKQIFSFVPIDITNQYVKRIMYVSNTDNFWYSYVFDLLYKMVEEYYYFIEDELASV